MPAVTLSIAEHRETARRRLEESEREFAAGEILPSLDKMWGAVSHAATAAALLRAWPHGSQAELRAAVGQLAGQAGDNGFLSSAFILAEMGQANVRSGGYSGFLEPETLETIHETVRHLVGRLLAFSEDGDTL